MTTRTKDLEEMIKALEATEAYQNDEPAAMHRHNHLWRILEGRLDSIHRDNLKALGLWNPPLYPNWGY